MVDATGDQLSFSDATEYQRQTAATLAFNLTTTQLITATVSDGDIPTASVAHKRVTRAGTGGQTAGVQTATYNGKDIAFQQDEYGTWICVLNYEHYGGENPPVAPGDTFPQLPNGLSDADTVNDLGTSGELRHVDNLEQFGSWDVDAVRLEAVTDNHNRKIHYFTEDDTVVQSIVPDSTKVSYTDITSQVTKYDDHTANLPDSAGSDTGEDSDDHIFGPDFPMYNGGTHHWAVAGFGKRWEVDDYPDDASNTTVHRVWVRANGFDPPTGGLVDTDTSATTTVRSHSPTAVSVDAGVAASTPARRRTAAVAARDPSGATVTASHPRATAVSASDTAVAASTSIRPRATSLSATDTGVAGTVPLQSRTTAFSARDIDNTASTSIRPRATTVSPTDTSVGDAAPTFSTTADVVSIDSGFIEAPSSVGDITVSTGFEPTFVVFTATNTNTKLNNTSNGVTADYGWSHGIADLRNDESYAVFAGTGSDSTNGCTTETTDSRPINIVELATDGTNITNRIQASISATSTDGFTLSFDSVGETEQIQYRAYELTSAGAIDAGFTAAPTSTGTASVTTGFRPNFVKFIGQPRATSGSMTVNDGVDTGLSHGWVTPTSQYAMAVTSYSTNVDDHVYGARNDAGLLILHADSKGGITGRTEATATLTDTGVDLEYTSVDGGGEVVLYYAIQASEGVSVDAVNAPTTTAQRTASANYRNAVIVSNASIPSLSVTEHSGSNQEHITYGWSHGQATAPDNEQVLSIGASSNSINAHRYAAYDGASVRLLHTDQNGGDEGVDAAEASTLTDTEAELTFTQAADSSDGVLASTHDTNPVIIWGFKQPSIQTLQPTVSASDTDLTASIPTRRRATVGSTTDTAVASTTPAHRRQTTVSASDTAVTATTPIRPRATSLSATDTGTASTASTRERATTVSTANTDRTTTASTRSVRPLATSTDTAIAVANATRSLQTASDVADASVSTTTTGRTINPRGTFNDTGRVASAAGAVFIETISTTTEHTTDTTLAANAADRPTAPILQATQTTDIAESETAPTAQTAITAVARDNTTGFSRLKTVQQDTAVSTTPASSGAEAPTAIREPLLTTLDVATTAAVSNTTLPGSPSLLELADGSQAEAARLAVTATDLVGTRDTTTSTDTIATTGTQQLTFVIDVQSLARVADTVQSVQPNTRSGATSVASPSQSGMIQTAFNTELAGGVSTPRTTYATTTITSASARPDESLRATADSVSTAQHSTRALEDTRSRFAQTLPTRDTARSVTGLSATGVSQTTSNGVSTGAGSALSTTQSRIDTIGNSIGNDAARILNNNPLRINARNISNSNVSQRSLLMTDTTARTAAADTTTAIVPPQQRANDATRATGFAQIQRPYLFTTKDSSSGTSTWSVTGVSTRNTIARSKTTVTPSTVSQRIDIPTITSGGTAIDRSDTVQQITPTTTPQTLSREQTTTARGTIYQVLGYGHSTDRGRINSTSATPFTIRAVSTVTPQVGTQQSVTTTESSQAIQRVPLSVPQQFVTTERANSTERAAQATGTEYSLPFVATTVLQPRQITTESTAVAVDKGRVHSSPAVTAPIQPYTAFRIPALLRTLALPREVLSPQQNLITADTLQYQRSVAVTTPDTRVSIDDNRYVEIDDES